MARIVIVGGGVSGLSLAYRLQQQLPTAEITVLEKNNRLGGCIGTVQHAGFRIEIGPNGFLDNKQSTLNLCRDLGLGAGLVRASEAAARNRFLMLRGKMHQLPSSPLAFLTSGVVSWRAKLALLTERFRSPRPDLKDESIDAFARRRTSAEIADTLVDAFVTGIHAGDPGLLSVRAAFPRFAELERQYGSLSKGMAHAARQRRAEAAARGETPTRQQMWSFPEGLGRLIDTLRQQLKTPPLAGVTVRQLERAPERGWIVRGEGQERWDADVVVLACPAYQQASLVADLDAELADWIGGIAYNCIAVVALGFRRAEIAHPLEGFGYLTPGRERRDVLGVQWCSSIYPGRAPEGMVLLRALCGGWHRPEMLGWDEQRLLTAVRQELRHALGIVADPVMHFLWRWERAIPQYHLGHLERLARIEERSGRYPGLFVAGNAFHGVSLNDCTEQAEMLSARIKILLAH